MGRMKTMFTNRQIALERKAKGISDMTCVVCREPFIPEYNLVPIDGSYRTDSKRLCDSCYYEYPENRRGIP